MRWFRLNRRGQIRGVDFSMSIIIFSLTITQILILTNTFIDGNRTLIDLDQQSEETEAIAVGLLNNNGYGFGTTDWATISTADLTSSNWNLGLSSNGKIDPFKLGRLSNRSLSGWQLSYDDIKHSLNLTQTVQIEILNPIDIQILGVTDDTLSTIIVNGTVTKLNKPLGQVEIWIYAINETQDVAQGYGNTDVDGYFDIQLPYVTALALINHFTIVAFAKFGESSQDADIQEYTKGSPGIILNHTNISVFDSSNRYDGYTVNVTSEFDSNVNSGVLTAFYPGISTGTANFSKSTLTQNLTTNLWGNDSVMIPQTGMVVFVGMGFLLGGTYQSLSIVKFPVTLDNQHSASITPPINPQATSTTTLISLVVRQLVLQLQLTTWEY